MVQGAVMLGLAWIFFFLGTIVMIQILIIFIREDRRSRRRFYGRFTDEEDQNRPDSDAIIETYFRFMEQAKYEVNSSGQNYTICQLCNKIFYEG